MSQQTTECTYFICDYAIKRNFCMLASALSSCGMSHCCHHYQGNGPSKIVLCPMLTAKSNNTRTSSKNSRWHFEIVPFFRWESLSLAFLTISIVLVRDLIYHVAPLKFISIKPWSLTSMKCPMPMVLILTLTRDVFLVPAKMILEEITQWVNSPNGDNVARIFFLSGVAGSKKSAIAHAITKLFDLQKQLGSPFCFDNVDQVNCHPKNLLSTIALDIADLDHHWKAFLSNSVKGNCSLQTTLSATEQFKISYWNLPKI
jgi:hypothetical protein